MGRKSSQQEGAKKVAVKRAASVIVSSDEEGETSAAMDLTKCPTRPNTPELPALHDESLPIDDDCQDHSTPKKSRTDSSFPYEVPAAPKSTAKLTAECSSDLWMQPELKIAYKFGESKYVVLAGNGGDQDRFVVYIRQFAHVKGTDVLYPSNQFFVRLEPQQAANLIYEIDHCRDLMHDGGPRFGMHVAHLGKRVQMSLNPEYGPDLDIRQFYVPKGGLEEVATKKGIRMTLEEFENLCVAIKGIRAKWPRLQTTKPCPLIHAQEESQEAAMACSFCNPRV